MNGFFSKKTIVTILIAILIAIIFSILSIVSGGKVSPVSSAINIISAPLQTIANNISDFFSDRSDRVLRYEELKKENEKLKNDLFVIKDELRSREADARENLELRAALGMRERNSSYVFEAAEIVSKNADSWSRSFTINKGSSSGLAIDNCVITSEGMVGFISELGATWATVTAITDTTMEAAAIASRTRDVASAEGDFELMSEGKFRLSYLSRDTQVLPGDVIESSGEGGLIPKGIVLGTVDEVKNETHGVSKYAIISPAVNLDQVNHVLVIKSFTQEG